MDYSNIRALIIKTGCYLILAIIGSFQLLKIIEWYNHLIAVTLFIWIFQILIMNEGYNYELKKTPPYSASSILDSSNKLYKRVLEVMIKLLDGNQDDENIRKKWPFTILIVEDKRANACAEDDGRIFITTEVLKICDNDDQLAFVLGHELAHISHKHHSIKYYRQMAYTISWFCWFCGLKGHGLFQKICKIIFTSYFLNPNFLWGLLWDLPYSRKIEREADETGFKLCHNAHFNLKQGLLYFDILEKLKKNQSSIHPHYFSTHPSHKTRSKHLTTLIQRLRLLDCS